jgi:hypothetical protein
MLLLLVLAILVMGFLNSYYARLAFAAGTLLVFSAALSLTSARPADIIVATAGYYIFFTLIPHPRHCNTLISPILDMHRSWVPFCRRVLKDERRYRFP